MRIKLNSHLKEIIKGGGFTFSAKVLSIGLGVITNFIVARYYGAEILGIVAIINSVMVVFAIIGTNGVNTAILRLIPEFNDKHYDNVGYSIYKQALVIVVLFSIISSIILFLLAPFIAEKIFNKNYLASFLILAAFFIAPQAIVSLNTDMLRALQKIKLYAVVQFVLSLIYFLLLFTITFVYYNIYNPVYVIFGSIFISCLLLLVIIFRFFKKEGEKTKSPISKSQIISISFPMFLTTSMHMVIANTDTWMLGIMRTEEEVGIYTIAMKLTLFSSFILTAFNTLSAPKFSELYHSGRKEELKNVAQNSTKLMFWISFPMMIVLILVGPFILKIFGAEFTTGYYALIFLVIGQLANISAGSVGLFLDMTGYQKVFRNIIIIGSFVNILLNLILIPILGINGAAIASMISIALWNIIASFYIHQKFGYNISYLPILSKVIR